jgi:GT2 family glycosyltransferase
MLVGVLLKDLMRYCSKLKALDASYLSICNRQESVEPSPDGSGYRCAWQWTSELHAPKVLPFLGRWLMKRALADHPIRCLSQPECIPEQPEVSFIIGHRGSARLPHLLATLESIAGQEGVSVECLVVEQDVQAHLLGHLPAWVRYLHTPPPTPNLPYCRAWAFNVGVRQARGPILVLHDNDMLVPADYAARILYHIRQGYAVANLKRFIFYLSETHSLRVFTRAASLTAQAPETIVQNLEAGGSVAITREEYERIGGFDEAFVGWGGEDNEFWERAQTLKVWPYGYLPLVHLWHPGQPGKYQPNNPTLLRHRKLSEIPANERIARLHTLIQGEMTGPQGWMGQGTRC